MKILSRMGLWLLLSISLIFSMISVDWTFEDKWSLVLQYNGPADGQIVFWIVNVLAFGSLACSFFCILHNLRISPRLSALCVCPLLVFAIVAGIALAIAHTGWFRVADAIVTYGGKAAPNVRVYRHGHDLLVDLKETAPESSIWTGYIVHPLDQTVAITLLNYPYWWAVTDLLAWPKYEPPWQDDMRDDTKGPGRDPKLSLAPGKITFMDGDGVIIHIDH